MAEFVTLKASGLEALRQIDERLVSYNVEMTEVTGGTFWKAYSDAQVDGTEEFPVIKDGNSCRSVLLNGKKLSWLDRQEDLARIGVWATRLYFTTENNQEVDRVLSDYVHPNPFDPGASTRGLYLRGLD